MVETVKCPLCGQFYEKGKDHECKDRQKIAEELSKAGDGSGHPSDGSGHPNQ